MLKKEELLKKAQEARAKSYSPYSKFAVGAALECRDGTVFLGANVENASYGLSMCAERNALYNAYMNGYKKEDFVALSLIGDSTRIISPCGACRQVLLELFPLEAPIHMATVSGLEQTTTMKELLPFGFDKDNL